MNKGHCTLISMYEVNQEERAVTGLELPVLCLLSYMYHHQATTSPQNCVLHVCIAYFTTITNWLLSEPCPNHPIITGVSPYGTLYTPTANSGYFASHQLHVAFQYVLAVCQCVHWMKSSQVHSPSCLLSCRGEQCAESTLGARGVQQGRGHTPRGRKPLPS